jgi:HAD superfamily hydrolase (TIGR01509 family)
MTDTRNIDWVILDAMGVIYRRGDDVADIMIPFLRQRGCELPEDLIIREFDRCSIGDISSEAMWRNCGLEDIDAVDLEYTFYYALNPGLMEALAAFRAANIRVACLSNGPGEWSRLLRRRFGLEEWIEKWVISGDVRKEKPDPAIYQIVLRQTGASPEKCLFVDDNPRNLPPAEKMGFRTFLFKGGAPAAMFAKIVELTR